MYRSKLVLTPLAIIAFALGAASSSSAESLTTLTSFNGTDGSAPWGDLTLIGSTFYGMTSAGGAHGDGTIFSIPVTGGTPTNLTSFNGTNGDDPQGGGLTLSSDGSTFYGVTTQGGPFSSGNVFSIPVTGGTPTTLATFFSGNGEYPIGSLALSATGQRSMG